MNKEYIILPFCLIFFINLIPMQPSKEVLKVTQALEPVLASTTAAKNLDSALTEPPELEDAINDVRLASLGKRKRLQHKNKKEPHLNAKRTKTQTNKEKLPKTDHVKLEKWPGALPEGLKTIAKALKERANLAQIMVKPPQVIGLIGETKVGKSKGIKHVAKYLQMSLVTLDARTIRHKVINKTCKEDKIKTSKVFKIIQESVGEQIQRIPSGGILLIEKVDALSTIDETYLEELFSVIRSLTRTNPLITCFLEIPLKASQEDEMMTAMISQLDRRIIVDCPDAKERNYILRYYLDKFTKKSKTKADSRINFEVLAQDCHTGELPPLFLKQIIHEAALIAFIENKQAKKTVITEDNILSAAKSIKHMGNAGMIEKASMAAESQRARYV